MRVALRSSVALLLAGLAGGCTSDDYIRSEGVTPGSGDAQAANTVMQMVDPWLYGVQDTDLSVPADRTSEKQAVIVESSENQQAPSTTGN